MEGGAGVHTVELLERQCAYALRILQQQQQQQQQQQYCMLQQYDQAGSSVRLA
jgi:hypothetical protein